MTNARESIEKIFLQFAWVGRVTFTHYPRSDRGQFAYYFYAKKALSRELLDGHFQCNARRYSEEDVRVLVESKGLSIAHFLRIDACNSGRFSR